MNFQNLSFKFKLVLNLDRLFNEIFNQVKIALYPKGHLSLSTLTRWTNQFKSEVGDLKDNHRIGRPITETKHAINI
jgi:transposase